MNTHKLILNTSRGEQPMLNADGSVWTGTEEEALKMRWAIARRGIVAYQLSKVNGTEVSARVEEAN